MLNRQKALLLFIAAAKRSVSKIELTKWSFMLRHESPSRGGNAFYDFLPYRYGPFSFCLFQELEKLVASNFIEVEGNQITLGKVDFDSDRVPRQVRADIDKIVARYTNWDHQRLIDYVYESYPCFTVNSIVRRLASRPTATPAVYTIGYESQSLDAVLDELVRSGIRRLVDVRRNPVARRFGFHKSTLQRCSDKVDIEYFHFPELGIASEDRRRLDSQSDYEKLFGRYETTTLQANRDSIATVSDLIADQASALMCMEADPKSCHRSRLAACISRGTGLPIVHLRAGECLTQKEQESLLRL